MSCVFFDCVGVSQLDVKEHLSLPQTFKKTKLLKLMFALNVCQDLRSWCTVDSNEFLSQFSLSPLCDVCLSKTRLLTQAQTPKWKKC